MKHLLAAAALLLGSAPAAATIIESGTGDWSGIPMMRAQVGVGLDGDAVGAIDALLARRECAIAGQRRGNIDMRVPFIVLFNASGAVDRLVVQRLDCPRAEGVLAGEVLRMIERGAFAPEGGRREGWFRGEVSFSFSQV